MFMAFMPWEEVGEGEGMGAAANKARIAVKTTTTITRMSKETSQITYQRRMNKKILVLTSFCCRSSLAWGSLVAKGHERVRLA